MQNGKVICHGGNDHRYFPPRFPWRAPDICRRARKTANAVKSTVFIGLSYLITVVLLILPYLLFPAGAYIWALAVTLLIAMMIIAGFNYYLSVAKERSFRRGFWTMAGISLGVAAISFLVGYVVKNILGISL